MVGLQKAANSDQFVQRFDNLAVGLESNKLVDTALSLSNKSRLCRYAGYAMAPLRLVGYDFMRAYRVHNVSNAVLAYCRENQQYLQANPVAKERVFSFLDLLATKTHKNAKSHASISGAKQHIEQLSTKPQDPPPAAPEGSKDKPAPVPAKDEVPNPLPAVGDQANAAQATDAAAKAALEAAGKSADKPAEKPASVPEPVKETLPPLVQLPPADAAKVRAKVLAVTAELGYNVLLERTPEQGKSGNLLVSPVGLMEMVQTVVTGSTSEQKKKELEKALMLTGIKVEGVNTDLAVLREKLREQGVTLITGCLAYKPSMEAAFPEKTDKQHTDALKALGINFYVGTKKAATARALFSTAVSEQTGIETAVLHRDFSKKGLRERLSCNISTVTHLEPTVALKPFKVEEKALAFADKSKAQFYGFSSVQVLKTKQFTLALLPYETEEGQATLSKVIFVPTDFDSFANDVTPNFVRVWVERLRSGSDDDLKKAKATKAEVDLFIPKMDLHTRDRDLLPLFTNKEASPEVKLDVSKLVGHDVSSLMQDVYFTESVPEVEKEEGELPVEEKKAAPGDAAKAEATPQAVQEDEADAAEEESAEAPPAREQLYIDGQHYYLVLSDNKDVVALGRVANKDGFTGKVPEL